MRVVVRVVVVVVVVRTRPALASSRPTTSPLQPESKSEPELSCNFLNFFLCGSRARAQGRVRSRMQHRARVRACVCVRASAVPCVRGRCGCVTRLGTEPTQGVTLPTPPPHPPSPPHLFLQRFLCRPVSRLLGDLLPRTLSLSRLLASFSLSARWQGTPTTSLYMSLKWFMHALAAMLTS